MVLLETWSDWSKAYYIEEDHGEEEETAGDAVNNQSRGGVGEDVVRHVGVTSSNNNNTKYSNQEEKVLTERGQAPEKLTSPLVFASIPPPPPSASFTTTTLIFLAVYKLHKLHSFTGIY